MPGSVNAESNNGRVGISSPVEAPVPSWGLCPQQLGHSWMTLRVSRKHVYSDCLLYATDLYTRPVWNTVAFHLWLCLSLSLLATL